MTETRAHTPGPWFVADGGYEDDNCGIGTQPGQVDVAQMVWREDARLIAAAPELLEACQKARSALSTLALSIVMGQPLGPVEQRVNEAQDALNAAIAKAVR